jgi:hypothetical protein
MSGCVRGARLVEICRERRCTAVHETDEALGQRLMVSPFSCARLMILSSMSVMLRT